MKWGVVSLMRYLKNKDRWLGFALAASSVWILSAANISTQWIGWSLSVAACFMWVWFGYKDKDWPRMIMELMYMMLSLRAVFNWLGM